MFKVKKISISFLRCKDVASLEIHWCRNSFSRIVKHRGPLLNTKLLLGKMSTYAIAMYSHHFEKSARS